MAAEDGRLDAIARRGCDGERSRNHKCLFVVAVLHTKLKPKTHNTHTPTTRFGPGRLRRWPVARHRRSRTPLRPHHDSPGRHPMELTDAHAGSKLWSLRQRRMASGRQGFFVAARRTSKPSRRAGPAQWPPLLDDVLHHLALGLVPLSNINSTTTTAAYACPTLSFQNVEGDWAFFASLRGIANQRRQ